MEAARERIFDRRPIAALGCTLLEALLVAAAALRWPVPWWFYALLLAPCLSMLLRAGRRYRLPPRREARDREGGS